MNIKCDSKLAVHVRAAASINNIVGKNVHSAFCKNGICYQPKAPCEGVFRAQVLFRNIGVLAFACRNILLYKILQGYDVRAFASHFLLFFSNNISGDMSYYDPTSRS